MSIRNQLEAELEDCYWLFDIFYNLNNNKNIKQP